jgi:high-affinity nickel permease
MIFKKELIKKEKLKKSTLEFRNELKKSTNTAIVAGFSILMALVWKDVITEYVDKITSISPVQGTLISALIITFISVLGIFIVTKVLKESEAKA